MWSNPRVPFQLASDRPLLEAPDGKPLMVNVVMNIEHWPFDREMPRGILPAPHGRPAMPPDVPNFAWVEYGLRCGMPRIMRMLAARDIRASAFLNAQVADVYPSLVKAVVEARWELVGHGWYQRSLKQSDDEDAEIKRCLARLETLDGRKPTAWLGAGMGETEATPDILKANGIMYLHDWLVDDLPCWMQTEHGPMVAMPYTFELNDVVNHVVQQSSSDEMLKRLHATLAIFDHEIAETGQPRVLTLGLHPHIIGVPHIAYHFEKALDVVMARDDVTFMTSSEIGEWFVAADGTDGKALQD